MPKSIDEPTGKKQVARKASLPPRPVYWPVPYRIWGGVWSGPRVQPAYGEAVAQNPILPRSTRWGYAYPQPAAWRAQTTTWRNREPAAIVMSMAPQSNDGRSMVVYTDWLFAAASPPARLRAHGSIGVYADDEQRDHGERISGEPTSESTQLISIVRALESVPKEVRSVVVKTRSKYAVDAIRDGIPYFSHNDWKTVNGELVQERPLLQYIAALMDQLTRGGQRARVLMFDDPRTSADADGLNAASYHAELASTDAPAPAAPDWDECRIALHLRVNDKGTSNGSSLVPTKNNGTTLFKNDVEPGDLRVSS